jgi:hypothetical protein
MNFFPAAVLLPLTMLGKFVHRLGLGDRLTRFSNELRTFGDSYSHVFCGGMNASLFVRKTWKQIYDSETESLRGILRHRHAHALNSVWLNL